MLQIKIEIQGFSFIQADIYGCYLPSRASIESVLEKITDKRKKQKICTFSNRLVRNLSERWSIPSSLLDTACHIILFEYHYTGQISLEDLDKLRLNIVRSQCGLSGYSFDLVVQNDFVEAWFDSLVGDRNHNNQRLSRLSGQWLKSYCSNSRSIDKKTEEIKPEVISQRMMEYPEYVIFRNFTESFNYQIYQIAVCDKRMQILIANDIKIMNIWFALIEKAESITHWNYCNKCQTHFSSPKMPSSRTCDSCQKKLQKQKKESRRIYPKGEFYKGGKCKGTCGSDRKRLNEPGYCRKCEGERNKHVI